jgi:hypothetical protein
MKKISLLLYLFIALISMSSCKKTEYTHAIPADATAVISVDMKSIVQKCGIGDEDNKSLKQHLSDALKTGLNNETAERLQKILDKPSESGLDLTEPIYIFKAEEFDGSTAVSLCVDDKGDLNSTVEDLAKSQLCTPPEDAGDYQFSIVMGKAVLAYNRGTALLVESNGGMSEKVRNGLDKVMKNKEEDSFCANEAFGLLKDSKEDVSFYLSTRTASVAKGPFSNATTSASSSNKGMQFVGNMTFSDGLISMKVDRYGSSEHATVAKGMRPISNAVMTFLPQHLPIMFTMGMDGAEAYKELINDNSFGDALKLPFIEKLFDSVKGDLTIGYDAFGKTEPAFLAYAQISNSQAVKSIYTTFKAQKNDDMGTLSKRGENDFVYKAAEKSIYYGVVGNAMYITNDISLVHFKVSGGTYAQNPYAGQTKGKTMFFVFDTSEIKGQPALQKKLGPVVSAALAQNVVCVKGSNVGTDSWTAEMIWKDKQTNALKQIIKIVRQIAGM